MPGTYPIESDDESDRDARLMAETASGKAGAFDELVRRHQARVFNLVYRSVGSIPDAEDLVQEVFLRVYRAAGRYQPSARFTTWLYRVTTNVIINWLRQHERRPVELARIVTGEEGEGNPALLADRGEETALETLARSELRAQVRRAIESLPPNQRLAVVLFRFEGLSYQEVAEALSCSVMAVKSLLSRARDNLRQRLAPYVGAGPDFSAEHAPPGGGSTQ